MQSFIRFWKQDIINKLIIIVASALILGGAVVVFLVVKMPEGRSLENALGEIFPSATPTFDMVSLLTKSVLTSGPKTDTPVPTFFLPTLTPPPDPALASPTPIPTALPTLTLTPIASPTLAVLPTNTAIPPTIPPALSGSADAICIPNNETHTGRVVEILDGNTARILIDGGLIYVVRYIGVTPPENKIYAEAARQKNSELAYGREVILVEDAASKDDRGRLMRYVMAGETFVNLELIRQGYGSALDLAPNSSCAQTLADAEQSARTSQLGMWSIPNP